MSFLMQEPCATENNQTTALRYATEADQAFWLSLDKHIDKNELLRKIRDRRCYMICAGGQPMGILRYNLFWDSIPFLTFLFLEESYRRKGWGTKALLFWESEMRGLNYQMVMTSTQVDEQAQHFYRKLGYIEKGCLFLDHTPLAQPQEMLMVKTLS